MSHDRRIIKAAPLPTQLADSLRERITRGDFPPGTTLPSENQLMDDYGVSRPTVRTALATLATERLIERHQGRGSTVRDTRALNAVITRTAGNPWDQLTAHGQPRPHRITADPGTAALLNIESGELIYCTDQPAVHTATGRLCTTRRYLPVLTLDGITPPPDPHGPRDAITAALTTHYPAHATHEHVRAVPPDYDERAQLHVHDGGLIQELLRVTCHTTTGRALIAEAERYNAEGLAITYPVAIP